MMLFCEDNTKKNERPDYPPIRFIRLDVLIFSDIVIDSVSGCGVTGATKDLGSFAERRGGSIPLIRTNFTG